ncbi:MarR family transcriptional regulator [Shinella curvata]|uniref:MarR family transcriptional regulator n=1 Tax=Shinella curvata TaxID=1817964 RepID=A0ABT8XPA4_9HYPH|nr:MarR family transcriptional regulator [Shinella curvata]MCJ8057153.1 MarR family transcriptional regulator [Shinella curvata]MDO6125000.1 MarR family transcriptional regulator [Shinella curvata]
MGTDALESAIRRRAIGGLLQPGKSPADAFSAVKAYLADGGTAQARETVYEKVQSLVFHLIAGRRFGGSLDEWAVVVGRIRGLVEVNDRLLAERFIVLGELLEQAHHFADVHSVADVLSKKHVSAILTAVGANPDGVDRKQLLASFNLGDANLSRILTNLVTAGLIDREWEGRDVTVKLSEYGRKIYLEKLRGQSDLASPSTPFTDASSLEQLRSDWPDKHVGLAVCSGERLLSWDRGFEQVMGVGSGTSEIAVSTLRQRLAGMAAVSDDVSPHEVTLPDGRTFSVKEHACRDGRSIWLSVDVSDYVKRIEMFKKRETILTQELAKLRSISSKTPHIYPDTIPGPDLLNVVSALKADILMPLTTIFDSATSLGSRLSNFNHDYQETIHNIASLTERIRKLTRALVRAGEAPRQDTLVSEDFSPNELVREIVENLSNTCLVTGIQIDSRGVASRRSIRGDRLGFEATLVSFLGCFFDHAKPGATVSIGSEWHGDAMRMSFEAPTAVYLAHSSSDHLLSLPLCVPHKAGYDAKMTVEHGKLHGEFEILSAKKARTKAIAVSDR